jgi:hypothetical protein
MTPSTFLCTLEGNNGQGRRCSQVHFLVPLQALLDKVKDDPRFMALPVAAGSLEAVHGAITTLLSDALLAKVQSTCR